MVDLEGRVIGGHLVVEVHEVVLERFPGSIREVTTVEWANKGAEATRRLHVALEADVIGQCRWKVFGVEDRGEDLVVGCLGRVGQLDMTGTGSMASLAPDPTGQDLGEYFRSAEYIAADGNIRVCVVAEDALAIHLATESLVIRVVEPRGHVPPTLGVPGDWKFPEFA